MITRLLDHRFSAPAAIGLAPLIVLILSWLDGGGAEASFDYAVKVTVTAELLVIAIAIRSGSLLRISVAPSFALMAILLLLLIAAGNITFTAPNPYAAALWTGIWSLHGVFAFACYRLMLQGRLKLMSLAMALIAGYLLWAAALLAFMLTIKAPATFNWVNDIPSVDHLRRVGYFAAPVAGLCFGLLAATNDKRLHILAAIAAIVAFAAIFWSGSRGALAAVAVTFLVMTLLFGAFRRISIWAAAGAALAAGAFLSLLLPGDPRFMGPARMLGASTGEAAAQHGFTTGRTGVWIETLQAIQQRPLFGYGEGQAAHLLSPIGTFQPTHPHNFPLQMLLGWGVAGTLLLLFLALPWLGRLYRKIRKEGGDQLPIFMGLLILILFSAVDGTLYHIQPVAIFAALLGVSYPARRHLKAAPASLPAPALLGAN